MNDDTRRDTGSMGAPDESSAVAPFLDAARAGNGAEVERLLPVLLPTIERKVRGTLRSWRSNSPGQVEFTDVLQEVTARLLKSPPSVQEGHTPKATLLAWVGTVTARYLISLHRKDGRETFHGGQEAVDSVVGPTGPRRPDEVAELRQRLQCARTAVAQDYPRGARVLELLIEDPELTSREMSILLGETKDNVNTIRFRVRRAIAQRCCGREGLGDVGA